MTLGLHPFAEVPLFKQIPANGTEGASVLLLCIRHKFKGHIWWAQKEKLATLLKGLAHIMNELHSAYILYA